jgi:hypothetical protein
MTDDGLEPVDVTGRWIGYYRYPSEEMGTFPIVAEIHQEGTRISGEMYDQITDHSDTLERILEIRRDEIRLVERAWLQAIVNHLGARSMIVTTRLPDTSDIRGKIQGDALQFTKVYRGTAIYNSAIESPSGATSAVSRLKCRIGKLG